MPLASFELETDVIANRGHDVSGVALELVATAGNYASRVQDIAPCLQEAFSSPRRAIRLESGFARFDEAKGGKVYGLGSRRFWLLVAGQLG